MDVGLYDDVDVGVGARWVDGATSAADLRTCVAVAVAVNDQDHVNAHDDVHGHEGLDGYEHGHEGLDLELVLEMVRLR